ncbi:MAG: (Fe-S)-binding protein [Gammaproteobacteria bacterium]
MLSEVNLTKAADQCVMCGLCLPHCPTYQVSQHEAESPRGRISLVKAYAEGQLSASISLEAHLQSCTGCMKCQQICPANVPYQTIIDEGRHLYREKLTTKSRLIQKLSLSVLTHQWGHQLLKISHLVANRLPIKNRFVDLLRFINKPKSFALTEDAKQSITILPGCTGALFDQQTLTSIVKLFSKLNINVVIPDKVMCCGALAQHSGYPQQAGKQVTAIHHFLNKQGTHEFLSFASGCGRHLDEHVANSQFKHEDIITWLTGSTHTNTLQFQSLTQRVLVHKPCTLNNDKHNNVLELLRRIPSIELFEFDDELICCGAGGMQLISPQDSNHKLMSTKIDTIRRVQPDIIVSTNIGCSLSMQLGLQDADLDINVVHPVTLLAQQLKA